MADNFVLTGKYTVTPRSATEPGFTINPGEFGTNFDITRKLSQTVHLDNDLIEGVAFGDLAAVGAHVVILDTRENKNVTVTVTSAVGVAQTTPSDTFLVISRTEPITAISLTRQPGIATVVDITLLQI